MSLPTYEIAVSLAVSLSGICFIFGILLEYFGLVGPKTDYVQVIMYMLYIIAGVLHFILGMLILIYQSRK